MRQITTVTFSVEGKARTTRNPSILSTVLAACDFTPQHKESVFHPASVQFHTHCLFFFPSAGRLFLKLLKFTSLIKK